MNPLFITNDMDRPCERLITELRDDGLLYYIAPEMQKDWHDKGMSPQRATPLSHFGIHVAVVGGILHGQYLTEESAHYPDGNPRSWQGSLNFSFPYPPKPMNTPFNVLDAIPNPDDVGADEYRSIHEALDVAECAFDPEMAMAVCEEFKGWAQTIIDKLEAALLERAARGE